MSRINVPRLAVSTLDALSRALERWSSTATTQLNNVSEGRIIAYHNALTAAPTTGDYAVGDFIKNSSPAEAGGAGTKYVIIGWLCTAAGTPGTWKECRCLTGN